LSKASIPKSSTSSAADQTRRNKNLRALRRGLGAIDRKIFSAIPKIYQGSILFAFFSRYGTKITRFSGPAT
jgi:hypothetical protein